MVNFSVALTALKSGLRIARAGWNGKGMWVALSPGNPALPADKFWSPHGRAHAELMGGAARVQPSIIMKTADDSIQMGWSPTTSDVLAEDWEIVE